MVCFMFTLLASCLLTWRLTFSRHLNTTLTKVLFIKLPPIRTCLMIDKLY